MEVEKISKPIKRIYNKGTTYAPYAENGNLYIPMSFCYHDEHTVSNCSYYLEIPHNVLIEAIQMQTYNG